jgi:glycerol-3-phosphate acyltransferase PlsY
MVAGCSFPVFILISPKTHNSIPLIIFAFLVAIMLIVTHRKNISRLRSGKESKIYIWRQPPRKDTAPPKE